MAFDRIWISAGGLIALGILYVSVQLALLPGAPVLEPDSGSYLMFSPIRTATYPLLLRAFGPEAMIVIQPVAYAAASAALSLYILAISRRALASFAIAIGLFINPQLDVYHSHIMSESLFMSALLIFFIAAIAFFRHPGWRLALLTSLLAGLAATIRPTGYALCPILLVMVLMARQSLGGRGVFKVLIAAIVPMLILVGAERLYANWVHGDQATSLAGRHFFAKSALIDVPASAVPETDPVRRQLFIAAEQTFAPIRDLLKQAPTEDIRSLLSKNYETCLEYACIAPLRAEIGLPEPEINKIALSFGLNRLSAAPLSYAYLSWLNYRSMWVFYPQSHPQLAPVFEAFVAQHRPLPFADLVPLLDSQVSKSRIALIVRPAMIVFGVGTGLAAIAALGLALWGRRVSPLLAAGLLAGLTVHVSLLWTALVGVGILRYTVSLWPLIVPTLVIVALSVIEAIRCRVRPGLKAATGTMSR